VPVLYLAQSSMLFEIEAAAIVLWILETKNANKCLKVSRWMYNAEQN